MAVVSRISTIRITDTATNSLGKQFQATATVQDTAAGSSVAVTYVQSDIGVPLMSDPDTATLTFVDDAGNVIRTVTLRITPGTDNITFFFTANGNSGGGNRCGTIEMKIRITKTTGGPTNTYDVDTDGSPNTPPSAHTMRTLDRGYIRGTTTVTEAISNISLGGGKNSPAQFGESLFVRLTQADQSYVARALSIAVSNTTPALSQNTNSSTATTRDVTFSSVVDKRFPAASTSVGVTATIPNTTLGTGIPDYIFTSTTDDTLSIDPRLTCEHLMQMDNSSFQTPPLTLNDADDQRLGSQLAYISTNVRAARGTKVGSAITGGVNGISLDTLLESQVDTNIETSQNAGLTATQGGEAGWISTFMTWSNSLPGGVWRKTVTIDTASSSVLTNAYLVQPTIDYTLIAVDPRIGIHAGITNPSDTADHLKAGDDIDVVAWIMNTATGGKEQADSGSMMVGVVRYNPDNNYLERLLSDTDDTSAAWEQWDQNELLNYFAMTPLVADANVFFKQFSATSGWGELNTRFLFKATLAGTPYEGIVTIEITGKANPHSNNEFDPVGIFK